MHAGDPWERNGPRTLEWAFENAGQVDAVGWLRSLLRPCSVDFCRRLFSLGVRVHLSLGLSGSGSQWFRVSVVHGLSGSGSQWCRHELSASVVIVCQRLDFAIGWGRTGARVPITMATVFLLFCFRMGIVAAK
jgi:hypothetical protein